MKKTLALLFTASLVFTGCASTDNGEKEMAKSADVNPVIAQAQADLKEVLDAGAQWRIVDPATGSLAVDMKKLMKVAEDKAAAGDTAEAERIAARISEVSKFALDQKNRYAGASPYYN